MYFSTSHRCNDSTIIVKVLVTANSLALHLQKFNTVEVFVFPCVQGKTTHVCGHPFCVLVYPQDYKELIYVAE